MARHDYVPFGEEIDAGVAERRSEWGPLADNVTQKFTGQERDSEMQLDFFQARYYSAAQGRFNSPDPMNAGANPFDPQSWNGYAYVRNNPLALTDPSGMDPCKNGEDADDCVYGGDPEPVPIDPCWYCGHIPGNSDGGSSEQPQQPPQPRVYRLFVTATGNTFWENLKKKFCDAIPDGRTVTIDIGVGGIASVHGAMQATLDYKTGNTSFVAQGGVSGGWNGALSATASMGFVYGSSNTNKSTNYSAGAAISGYYQKSGAAKEVGLSVGWGFLGKYNAGVTQSQSTSPAGNVPGLELPFDFALLAAKRVCQ